MPYFIDILKSTANRSTCSRKQVSSLVVHPKNYRILSMGYNGTPPGCKHCVPDGCFKIDSHCKGTLHAEVNALANLEKVYDELLMVSMYSPCIECTKILIAFGVKQVFYIEEYVDKDRDKLLKYYGKGKITLEKNQYKRRYLNARRLSERKWLFKED